MLMDVDPKQIWYDLKKKCVLTHHHVRCLEKNKLLATGHFYISMEKHNFL